MPPKLAKGFDLLGELSGEEEEEEEQEDEEEAAAAPARPKAEVDYESLQRAGYRGGPSVLYLPEAKAEAGSNFQWGRGTRSHAETSTAEERAALEHAAGAGLEAQVEAQLREAQRAKALRDAARAEEFELRGAAAGRGQGRGSNLTFNQREKRKRERGQAVSGRNFGVLAAWL